MKKILVTGGAGYIGSVLARILLNQGHAVRVIDSLNFGGDSMVELLNNPNFEFCKGDIRESADVAKAAQDCHAVLHLAAIVGDPACSKAPDEARSTNLDGSKLMYKAAADAGVERFVFASTCSNYGKMEGTDYVVETSALNPISLYAETKVEYENFLREEATENCIATTCRFSTVYGLSPRPRFDLTVNEFTRDVALGRELVIYGAQFWRPYCHVVDLARSMITVMDSPAEKVRSNVFNVGSTSENYTKGMLVEEIGKAFPDMNVSFVEKDEDPRDYRVNSDKIKNELGFEITYTVPEGIRQIATALENGLFSNPDHPQYKNI